MRKYEMLIILRPALKDEDGEKVVERVRGEITKLNGVIEETRNIGRRQFARRMDKEAGGMYVKLFFNIDPASMANLNARLKLNEDLFRVQVTDAEVLPAQMYHGEGHGKPE